MHLLTSPDMKQYYSQQLVEVGQKVPALLPNTKSPSCHSLMNFGCLTRGNGTACHMIYNFADGIAVCICLVGCRGRLCMCMKNNFVSRLTVFR
mmetsp:Transcript_10052/g.17006  ORF Transcript_10052/g.17006 Transcript_10052/m.17006 type:complete len:93 (-) Transcript_10052:98-376(-)